MTKKNDTKIKEEFACRFKIEKKEFHEFWPEPTKV